MRESNLTVIVLSVFFLLAVPGTIVLALDQSSDTEKSIISHFLEIPAEQFRYEGTVKYGETLEDTLVDDTVIAMEKRLLQAAVEADLFSSSPRYAMAIAHNLVVHDQRNAGEYLRLMGDVANLDELNTKRGFTVSALASGEIGELFAAKQLTAKQNNVAPFWSEFLARYAIYSTSIPELVLAFEGSHDEIVKANIVRAVASIGQQTELPWVREHGLASESDRIQAAGIFAFVEIVGFDGIAELEGFKTIGRLAADEKTQGLDWLKNHTSRTSPHGVSMSNDDEFVSRFWGLTSCPAINWLHSHSSKPKAGMHYTVNFSASDKKEFLCALRSAKGFGMEAIKGDLLRIVAEEDEISLLEIRKLGFYLPNEFAFQRRSSIDIIIRHLRHTKCQTDKRSTED